MPAKDRAANRGGQRTSNPLNATSNIRDKSLLAGSFRRRVQILRISAPLAVAAKWSASSEANRSMRLSMLNAVRQAFDRMRPYPHGQNLYPIRKVITRGRSGASALMN